MSSTGRSVASVLTLPIRSMMPIPEDTRPKIVCLPSSQGVGARVMKNWDPFVFGPAFAMLRMPAPVCFRSRLICRALTEIVRVHHENRGNRPAGTPSPSQTAGMPLFPGQHFPVPTSSSNFPPQMDSPPLPVPVGSPPWIIKSLMTRWKTTLL